MTPDDLDAIFDSHGVTFPERYLAKANKRVDVQEVVSDWGPLTQEHVEAAVKFEASGAIHEVSTYQAPQKLRHTHHRLAQLLANGMDEGKAAAFCGLHARTISALKATPIFQELLHHYAQMVTEEWADFNTTAAALSHDLVDRLREVLDESPEKFTVSALNESIRTLRDYSGNAPVTKSQNVNVNIDLGERLRAARERANSAIIEAQALPRTGT